MYTGCSSGSRIYWKFIGGFQWYMMDSKDIKKSISLKLRNENGEKVSFNGQSITFQLSIKEI